MVVDCGQVLAVPVVVEGCVEGCVAGGGSSRSSPLYAQSGARVRCQGERCDFEVHANAKYR